ncbi:MAG TPA: hypothetical protein VJU61_04425 [Polyangiaceae bacterium]|nr:hypothetical protein [Polyangiaceae bacterium]
MGNEGWGNREGRRAGAASKLQITGTCAGCAVLAALACRPDPSTTTTATTGLFGEPGSGFTAQCSGWFPDWISSNPPPPGAQSFQLSQGYPLGVPVLKTVGGQVRVDHWDPPAPAALASAPWLAFDFHNPAQRTGYLDALKAYLLLGMPEVDFVAQKNTKRPWFHVPLMTAKLGARREPYHGVTRERALRACDHSWIIDGGPCPNAPNRLQAVAIGYYNWLGGYTIGQVFKDPDPGASDPAASTFIDGAFVFKLLFAEFDATKIDQNSNPLDGAPEWQVQDAQNPGAALLKMRLIQVDVAVKDSRSAQTGWVFATYVYDKALTAVEPVPWRRLTAVGLQWGNDPDVTGPGVGTLDESWINPALPAVFQHQGTTTAVGRDGRLNGPVDNPISSCISCHSTAQLVVGKTSQNAFRGVDLVPRTGTTGCSNAQAMTWFRNVVGGTPFGVMDNDGAGCALATPQPGTPPLRSLDYSLQFAVAFESAFLHEDPNPCQALAATLAAGPARATERDHIESSRAVAPSGTRVVVSPDAMRTTEADEPSRHER